MSSPRMMVPCWFRGGSGVVPGWFRTVPASEATGTGEKGGASPLPPSGPGWVVPVLALKGDQYQEPSPTFSGAPLKHHAERIPSRCRVGGA